MIKKNFFSIMVALLLLYLSLTNTEKFHKVPLNNIPFIDKIVHMGMYFVFMSVFILEHRKTLRNSRNLFALALIPLAYGILMEILQLTLTVSRSGDIYDALADAAGILISILIWLLVKPSVKIDSDKNMF
jgi:VanZ family protein